MTQIGERRREEKKERKRKVTEAGFDFNPKALSE